MSYNPGGMPPYSPQQPYSPPPPKSGMSTGAKLAIFGCLGLIVILAIPSVGLLIWYAVQESDTSTSSTSKPDSTSSSKENKNEDDDDSTKSSSKKSGVYVDSIRMARDDGSGSAGETVTSFEPADNPMHFVLTMSEFEKGTEVRVVLTAIDADKTPNVKVGEVSKTLSSIENQLDVHWTLPRDWPTGNYKVDAYVNGTLDKTLKFRVDY